ncbi:MAG: hypothetical protein WC533_01620 [Candidatus Pacearchaeota archaeon]
MALELRRLQTKTLEALEKEFAEKSIASLCDRCERALTKHNGGMWGNVIIYYRQFAQDVRILVTEFGKDKGYERCPVLNDLRLNDFEYYQKYLEMIKYIRDVLKEGIY